MNVERYKKFNKDNKTRFLKRKKGKSVVLEYKWMQIKTRLRMHSLFYTVCIASV